MSESRSDTCLRCKGQHCANTQVEYTTLSPLASLCTAFSRDGVSKEEEGVKRKSLWGEG